MTLICWHAKLYKFKLLSSKPFFVIDSSGFHRNCIVYHRHTWRINCNPRNFHKGRQNLKEKLSFG